MKTEKPRHLSEREWQAIQDYSTQLRQICPDQVMRLVLYGSKARGDDDIESDIDLFVVLDEKEEHLHQLEDIAYRIDLRYDVVLSDLIVDSERYSWMKRHREPLMEHIEQEGIEL